MTADARVFSKVEADQILRRAAEIDGSDETRPLTLDDLKSIAWEAGFGARAVERAIAEAHQAMESEERRSPVRRSGWVVTHLSTVRIVPMEISSEQLTRAVRLCHPYREGPAQVKLEERRITWRDGKGLRFIVTSGDGRTEIRVFVSKLIVRRGRWTGWVKAAADRLETLVHMVAADGPEAPKRLREAEEPQGG